MDGEKIRDVDPHSAIIKANQSESKCKLNLKVLCFHLGIGVSMPKKKWWSTPFLPWIAPLFQSSHFGEPQRWSTRHATHVHSSGAWTCTYVGRICPHVQLTASLIQPLSFCLETKDKNRWGHVESLRGAGIHGKWFDPKGSKITCHHLTQPTGWPLWTAFHQNLVPLTASLDEFHSIYVGLQPAGTEKKRNQSSWTLRGTILHCHHCRSQTSRPACTADKRLAAPPTAVRIDLSFRKDVPSVHAKCWSILLSTHELSPVLVFMVLNPTPQTQPAVPPAVPWTSAGGTTSMKGLRAVGNTSCTRCRETMAKVIGAPALEAMDEGWRMKKDEESAACWSRWHKMSWDVVRWLVVPCHPLTKVVALPKHLGPPASHMLASPQHHPEAASQ